MAFIPIQRKEEGQLDGPSRHDMEASELFAQLEKEPAGLKTGGSSQSPIWMARMLVFHGVLGLPNTQDGRMVLDGVGHLSHACQTSDLLKRSI